MLSAELEFCLNEAFQKARHSQHEFLTVEHLLLAITDIPGVIEVLKSCGADVPRLRKDLQEHIEETTPLLSGETEQASSDFQSPYLVKLLSSAPLSEHITYYGSTRIRVG